MAHWGAAAELDLAQRQRERHGGERDQHERPEGVHIGEERGLQLNLLPDPVDRLLMRLGERAAMGGEVARHLVQRVLVLDARRDRMLDEPALMKLLAMRLYVRDDRDADRAAGIARRVDQ